MNNSLERIYDAMSAALRRDILPHLDDAHARRQAIAMLDLVNHLRLRTDWAPGPIREAVAAAVDGLAKLETLFEGSPVKPPSGSVPALPERGATVSELIAVRDELDELVGRVLEWLDQHREELGEERAGAATALLRTLMDERLRRELELTPKPLFGEM